MTYITSHHIKVAAVLAASLFILNPAKATDNVKNGAKIYGETCVACHGENGAGAFPGVPDFTATNGRLNKTDAILVDHIDNGFESPLSDMAMPERGGNEELTEQDIKDVLCYLRAEFQQSK